MLKFTQSLRASVYTRTCVHKCAHVYMFDGYIEVIGDCSIREYLTEVSALLAYNSPFVYQL